MHGSTGTKLTPAMHAAIVDAVRKGLSRTSAFKLVGIGSATGFEWLARGEAGDEPYGSFRDDVEKAEVEYEEELLDKVRDAATSGKPNTWQAAMTLLERRWPDRYGRNDRLTVEGDPSRPVNVVTQHVLASPERAQLVLDRLAELTQRRPVGELVEGEVIEAEVIEDD